MPLFLCDLAPLLGKDEDTLARWCERGDVIPGAYRTRGGQKRRGKWRVAVPRAKADDLALAQAMARRDAVDLEECLALLTLDRLCNRIATNARKFARARTDKAQAVQDWREFISREAADLAAKGFKVHSFDVERFRRDYVIGAVPLVAAGKNPARAAVKAFNLQCKGGSPRSGRELRKFGSDLEADPEYALAVALAADARRRGEPSQTTLKALAMQFGLTLAQLRRQPALEEKLKRAHKVAHLRAKDKASKEAPNLDDQEQRDLRRDYDPMRAEKDNPKQLQQLRELRKWIEAMSPDQLSETYEGAHALPDVRRMIEAIKKRRAT
jgi:hypothetical protein